MLSPQSDYLTVNAGQGSTNRLRAATMMKNTMVTPKKSALAMTSAFKHDGKSARKASMDVHNQSRNGPLGQAMSQ